jgi:hypothetical protein
MPNTNDPEMCFIKAIEDYLKSEYGIPIDQFNNIGKKEMYCKKKFGIYKKVHFLTIGLYCIRK